MPVAMPTWRKVLLMPEAMPLRAGGTTPTAVVASGGFTMPTPTPGDHEPGQQVGPARSSAQAAHQQQRRRRRASARRRAARGAAPGPRGAPRSAGDEERDDRERQEAQPGLERRVAEHVLDVERQVEEHREHRRRQREGGDRRADEGRLAEQRRGRTSGCSCRSSTDHEARPSARPTPSSSETICVLPQPSSLPADQGEHEQKSERRERDQAEPVDRRGVRVARLVTKRSVAHDRGDRRSAR